MSGTGELNVSSGGLAIGTVVTGNTFGLGGGGLYVSSGGTASGTMLMLSGREFVSAGGSTTGTVIDSGGIEYVLSGGSDVGATINGGGEQDVVRFGERRDGVYRLAGGRVRRCGHRHDDNGGAGDGQSAAARRWT